MAFIDDDDEVSERYIELICDALGRRPEVDCLGIRGVITFRGSHPCEFVHSVRYSDMFSRNHTYYRPPTHLNPIRRAIAVRYPFPDVSYSEDFYWALRMRDDRALQREEFIESVLYYYHSQRWWGYQWLLDGTEALRHKLGIRMVNRLRIRNPGFRLSRQHRLDEDMGSMPGTEAGGRPAISVVIPVRNGAGTLHACLESVYRSVFSDFEVVVVDDGSVDGTAAVAGSFPCALLKLPENSGAATARNIGARESHGRILFFLDADILIRPQTLGMIVRAFSERTDVDALFGSYAKECASAGFFSRYKNLSAPLHASNFEPGRRDLL